MNPYKENRIGKFFIARKCIVDNWDLSYLFKHVIIVRAESLFHKAGIEYVAYSHLFGVNHVGAEPPNYKLILEGNELIAKKIDGEPSYFERRMSAITSDVSTGNQKEL
jgi:hypothetical protein